MPWSSLLSPLMTLFMLAPLTHSHPAPLISSPSAVPVCCFCQHSASSSSSTHIQAEASLYSIFFPIYHGQTLSQFSLVYISLAHPLFFFLITHLQNTAHAVFTIETHVFAHLNSINYWFPSVFLSFCLSLPVLGVQQSLYMVQSQCQLQLALLLQCFDGLRVSLFCHL